MKVKRTGFILYVKKYQECIEFYKNILELQVVFKNESLTCFDLFGTYLMIEIEDREEFLNLESNHKKAFGCIRINVDKVKEFSQHLKAKNIKVDYQEHSWGTIAKFLDPDGNLLAFKDEEGFAKQIETYKQNSK
ncbi:VOC family protein [Aquimarina sp. MMG016]|uniref:VOC family protein n=1 Tax=Aquimarina sp. MMG016 TaxID=2822690 RepID=UPI001B3A328B|nr:VOC family protein [Aquimarina sp. MMG016]MBQ4820455.1 VOC family protein [Aquimarina sp. MMG016]